jgi:hypothetical protein
LDPIGKARDLNRRIKKKGIFLGGSHGFLFGRPSAPGGVFRAIPAKDAVRVETGIFKQAQDLGQAHALQFVAGGA